MEKHTEKALEKIHRFFAKNQVEKAEQLLHAELETAPSSPELLKLRFYYALKHRSWQSVLGYLTQTTRYLPVQALVDEEISNLLFLSFENSPAFKSAFFEFLLNNQYYQAVLHLLNMGGEQKCKGFVQSWDQAAEQISDSISSGNWYVASGIAYLQCHDMASFKNSWRQAVSKAPSVLPAIIGFCQRTGMVDLSGTEERIFLIELFLLAGSVKKGLTLMKVMADESQEYARLLLRHFKDFRLEGEDQTKLIQLKTSLGISAEDLTFLQSIQGEWIELNVEQLFIVQKALLQSTVEPDKRKKLMLGVVQAYFAKEEWESSAQLLETLDEEKKDPEIIAMMEHLLERYPIIPRLHVKVGDFQLSRGMVSQAVQHYLMVLEVPKFRKSVIQKLEHAILSENSYEVIEHLIDFYPADSCTIPILGLRLLLSPVETKNYDWFPNCFLQKMPMGPLHPLWYMFLIALDFDRDEISSAVQYTVRFIEECPDHCYEAIPLIENNSTIMAPYVVQLISAISKNLSSLAQKDIWSQTLKHLEKSSSISQNLEGSDFFKTLHEIEDLIENKEFSLGFQMLQRMAHKHEDALDEVIKFHNTVVPPEDFFAEWAETKMGILLRGEKFDSLLQFSKSLLIDNRMRQHVSLVHQYLGWCQESSGNIELAIEHFCYGALEKKWFRQNFEFFKNHLFQGFHDQISNVLALIKKYGDDIAAQEISELWYEHKPEEVQHIHQFNEDYYQQHQSGRSTSNLVLWAVSNREFSRAREILKSLDPREAQFGIFLPKIVQVFKLKQPQDPTARFLLGRFFLFQNQTEKAVDVFRDLVRDLPHTLDDVFSYLKKSVVKGICKVDPHLIFGLLIRISLDQKLFREGIDLLREFGKWDQKAASSFVEGIFKVLKQDPEEKQAYYDFLKLNAEWGDYVKVCEIEETGVLAEELFEERMEWLKTASTIPDLKNRAIALRARILFSVRNFDGCRKLILLAIGDVFSCDPNPELLESSRGLLNRFGDDLTLQRAVAFSLWRNNKYFEAIPLFKKLLKCNVSEFRIDAFALLKEMGEHPNFKDLFVDGDSKKDTILLSLGTTYDRLKQTQMKLITQGLYQPSYELFFWLLDKGRFADFRSLLQTHEEELGKDKVQILEAYYLRGKGKVNQAAFRLLHNDCPAELKKMFFLEAGLWEQALLAQGEESPDLILRKRILAKRGKPRSALLQLSHIGHLSEKQNEEEHNA